ncbi:hypothetical protein Taro_052348 [Colocasia esculenta]|uniref:Uncharacterized protein n=1 Tax=Colocasia esculenta TaxID=4460 RepID=A0A843XJ40_COLES|nr:hypothetical protein [Colocasia esculenta]
MRQDMKHMQIFYPVTLDQFLACASFAKVSFFKMDMDRDSYADFLEKQLALHLCRMAPSMGPTYSISLGVFKPFFEKQEEQALHLRRMAPSMGPTYSISLGVFKPFFEKQEEQASEIISHYTSLLSLAHYLPFIEVLSSPKKGEIDEQSIPM